MSRGYPMWRDVVDDVLATPTVIAMKMEHSRPRLCRGRVAAGNNLEGERRG